jgi:hypothetical protein
MKMKTVRQALLILTLLFGAAIGAHAQAVLTQTTLANAVSGPAGYSGTSPTVSTYVCLASVSGISAPTLPGTPVSVIYVGREAMGVFAVNATSNCVTVNRGYLGTQASPHPSGDMVLVAPAYQTTLAQGGNPVPSGLFNFDPPQNGTCTPGAVPTPWVNVLTGAQWLCSTITNTFVPGFNNPLQKENTALVADAAGAVLPSGPLFEMGGGTNAVTGFTIPVGCDATAVGGCQFTVIPTTAWTWTTAGNIATAGTAVAKLAITFRWDATASKFIVQQSK